MRDWFGSRQARSNDGSLLLLWAGQTPEWVFLILLLLVELWIFSGAFNKFFTHDSLFYMIHVPHTWEQFRSYLLAPSEERSYRPLNLAVSALFRPFLGVDPVPYHWIPIVFHLLNTLLFYLLAKRILANPAAGLAAAAFWGLHSVAGWITYDITYLSDFLLAFLLLVSLLLSMAGVRRKSRLLVAASLVVYVLSLLTKEAAITFPLAFWICLTLEDLRASNEPFTMKRITSSARKAFLLSSLYLIIAMAFAFLFVYWLESGRIYAQGSASAYDINPLANPLAKIKYVYWALNLPDVLNIYHAEKNRTLALGLMSCLLTIWGLDILRRRGQLSVVEWAGVGWLVGLNVPALLLSHRLAKWYLYIPLMGLALAFGVLAENLRALVPEKLQRIAGLVILVLLIGPFLFSSLVQTRSYVVASDSAYQSDLLQACLHDFQQEHPVLPPQVTLFFLPAFEEGVSDLLSAPPIDRGGLFALYYPNTRVQALFAHKGQLLAENIGNRSDVFVLQYLDRHLYDVTSYMKSTGKMTLYLLPTSEGEAAPLLKKVPAGGRTLHERYVRMLLADQGAQLPDDYLARRDIWILQYAGGHFDDLTSYYVNDTKSTMLLLPTIDGKAPLLRTLKDDPDTAARLRQSHVRLLSSDDLARLPGGSITQPDTSVFQCLDGHFYDVTGHFKSGGKMGLFLLPTFEGKIPSTLRRDPKCHNKLCTSPVDSFFADEGSRLPDDYYKRDELWILQYLNGRFSDASEYYKGRHRDAAWRVVRNLEDVQCSVNRAEYYPDYEHFQTPTGAPVFFQGSEKETLTQIGGSTIVVPLYKIPGDARLRFDVSWMFEQGDGGWAEAVLRSGGKESVVFREYMLPDPKRKSLLWKEVSFDLQRFANQEADLVLKCFNNPGNNTVADWLNWRDIVIETKGQPAAGSR